MLSIRSKIFFSLCIYFFLSGAANAQDPSRPVTLFIIPAVGSDLEVFTTQISLSSSKKVEVKSKSGTLCSGLFGSKGNNWVLKKLSCSFTDEIIEEAVLKEYPKNGYIKHGITQIKFDSGAIVGVLLHTGDERTMISTRTVDMNDVKKFYGEFPNWNLP